jgi:CheY-like chemotaxis protein
MARILIADDNPDASEVIARICAFQGHEVAEARDASQAMQMFESFCPDLVITDLAMPMGGGQQLISNIRATAGGDAFPVIVISGYTGMLGEAERERLAPCTILAKPLDLGPMMQAVASALARAG